MGRLSENKKSELSSKSSNDEGKMVEIIIDVDEKQVNGVLSALKRIGVEPSSVMPYK